MSPELIAYVTPKCGRAGVWSWVVATCPICGKRHTHGGGSGELPDHLGQRVAHCGHDGEPGVYTLEEAPQ